MSLTITSAAALASACDIAGVVGPVGEVLLHAASPRAAASAGGSNGLRVLGCIGLAGVRWCRRARTWVNSRTDGRAKGSVKESVVGAKNCRLASGRRRPAQWIVRG